MKQKAFFYTDKTYQSATYTETYSRVSRQIRIDYTLNGAPYFRHGGRRYCLNDFMRVNPFIITARDGETVTICGYEAKNYYKPLFIEIDTAGEYCRLYRFEERATDNN